MGAIRTFAAVCAVLLVAGCTHNPAAGPEGRDVIHQASASLPVSGADVADPRWDYALVDITPRVVGMVPYYATSSLYTTFGGGKGAAPEITFGVGDVVTISVFEATSGGLFIPEQVAGSRPGNFVTLPNQTVDRQGNISVPFAGQVRAAGRTAEAVQTEIQDKLKNRAIEPQVIVALAEQRASEVTVFGAVTAPARFSIDANGTRTLDAIARAGGPSFPGYESFVTLQRNNRSATIAFDYLIDRPNENIYVRPGDSIYVYREQQTFTAFGASGQQGMFNFDSENLTLAQGVAKAGGLIDGRAEARHVFVYRFEPRKVLAEMGIDTAKFETENVPTIYRLDLRSPRGFFLAGQFPMRNADVLYVSNAHTVELVKFLTIVRSVTSAVRGAAFDVDDLVSGRL